jgi:catechol 2,3-dioxygenase
MAVSASAQAPAGAAIDPRTTVGAVHLTVSDLGRARRFYEEAIGLRGVEVENGEVAMATPAGQTLVQLHGDSSAAQLDRRATGLFHLAILHPSRRDLAFALARLSAARWPLDGASDHLVSEALYLSDPDGNGIELYRDRPQAEWSYDGGQLQMATLPLDLRSLADELRAETELPHEVAAETRMGHVHLQVAELERTEAFYAGLLGFDVVVRGYPGALFVSAGGYHHHIGLNTWRSAGHGPAQPGSLGLRYYEVLLPGEAELEAVLVRLQSAGVPSETAPGAAPGTHCVRDPSGNALVLRAA